jgi:hypothetical protein
VHHSFPQHFPNKQRFSVDKKKAMAKIVGTSGKKWSAVRKSGVLVGDSVAIQWRER